MDNKNVKRPSRLFSVEEVADLFNVIKATVNEIYRVFHNQHPDIVLQDINMNEAVKFMIGRAKTDARR